jgi:hypothetical protein
MSCATCADLTSCGNCAMVGRPKMNHDTEPDRVIEALDAGSGNAPETAHLCVVHLRSSKALAFQGIPL